MAICVEKIRGTVLHEAHKCQIEKAMAILSEGPEEFYRSYLD